MQWDSIDEIERHAAEIDERDWDLIEMEDSVDEVERHASERMIYQCI